MRHILVATDGSEPAIRAVDIAVSLAKATGAELSILTVAGHLSGEDARHLTQAENDLGAALELASNDVLSEARDRATRARLSTVSDQIAWGEPGEVIIRATKEMDVDAVVVGRRGRGRLEGLLLGSVSQKVASLASCAVVVVP